MNGLRYSILNLCLLVATSGSGVSTGICGEKIVLSDDKPKGEPNAPIKGGGDLFKSWSKVDQPGFDYNVLGLPTIPRNSSLDKEELKRLKNIRDEKKNWLLLEPGELQRKEAEKKNLGVDNRPLDSIDKSKDDQPTDYTFKGVGEKNAQQRRQPGELRPMGQGASKEEVDARIAQQQRDQDSADNDGRREKFTLTGGNRETQLGAHTASELNFNNLFSPGKNDALIAGSALKSESGFSLKDALGNQPVRSKEQQAKMDDFNRMMSAPLASGATFGMAGSLSLPPTATTPGPALPRPDDSAARPAVNPLFNPNVSSAPLPNRLLPPGLPTINSTPGYAGAAPFQSTFPSDTPRNWSRPPQELPRRKF